MPQDSCVRGLLICVGRQAGRHARGHQMRQLLGDLAHPSTRTFLPPLSRMRLRSQSRGRCSSSRRRCPTSAARSLARRPRPSLGSFRHRTRVARHARHLPWRARRPVAVMLSLMVTSQPPPQCPEWWCAGSSRPARRRAAHVGGASGPRGGLPLRAGGARTRPVALGAGVGARAPVGRLRSRGARGRGGLLVLVTVLVGVLMMVL